MKSKIVLAGLLVMVAVMIASFSSAMATDQTPPLTVSQQDVVWTVEMHLYGLSGKDVTAVQAEYWILLPVGDGTYYPEYHTIAQVKTSFADSQIKLWFDPNTFPAS